MGGQLKVKGSYLLISNILFKSNSLLKAMGYLITTTKATRSFIPEFGITK